MLYFKNFFYFEAEVCGKSIDQLYVTSSPFAALFKVLLEDQKRIVCVEFQWRLSLSVHFLNILSPKVPFFSEIAKIV